MGRSEAETERLLPALLLPWAGPLAASGVGAVLVKKRFPSRRLAKADIDRKRNAPGRRHRVARQETVGL